MSRALREMLVEGIRTNIGYHRWLVNSPEFVSGEIDTGLLERSFTGTPPAASPDRERAAIVAAVLDVHEEAARMKPVDEDGGEGMDPWRLLGRPGALRGGH
jgi:acetyl-CoA/propionyl-CoA carboxylase biotin carboxyl carrier protein